MQNEETGRNSVKLTDTEFGTFIYDIFIRELLELVHYEELSCVTQHDLFLKKVVPAKSELEKIYDLVMDKGEPSESGSRGEITGISYQGEGSLQGQVAGVNEADDCFSWDTYASIARFFEHTDTIFRICHRWNILRMRQISHNISEYLNRGIARDERNMGIEVPSHNGDGSDELRERLNMLERDIRRLERAWDERNVAETGSSNVYVPPARGRHREEQERAALREERTSFQHKQNETVKEINSLKQPVEEPGRENHKMGSNNVAGSLVIRDDQDNDQDTAPSEPHNEKGSIRRKFKDWIEKR